MATHLLGRVIRNIPKQALVCSVPSKLAEPCAAFHGRARIGNRDVVGFGINGSYTYIDRIDYPMPAIRFKENSSDVLALREKEKGDWKKLTLAEKKELYRASFCLTFAEQKAPTGDWKFIIGGVLICSGLVLWVYTFLKKFVYPPMPASFSPERQKIMLQRMIDLRVDPIDGFASKYDYENKRWKD